MLWRPLLFSHGPSARGKIVAVSRAPRGNSFNHLPHEQSIFVYYQRCYFSIVTIYNTYKLIKNALHKVPDLVLQHVLKCSFAHYTNPEKKDGKKRYVLVNSNKFSYFTCRTYNQIRPVLKNQHTRIFQEKKKKKNKEKHRSH